MEWPWWFVSGGALMLMVAGVQSSRQSSLDVETGDGVTRRYLHWLKDLATPPLAMVRKDPDGG